MSAPVSAEKRAKPAAKEKSAPAPLSVVAIGASAGGLEAVSKLLRHLPADTGMAFFYIQHLSPDHTSNLEQLLSSASKLVVKDATDLSVIRPDHLYLCTPNTEMKLVKGKIRLISRSKNELPYLPIDSFFASVAKAYGERSIGVVLSGNATDGTLGVRSIRLAGGLTFAQDDSAKNPGMPRSAIDDGGVDYIMSPEDIAAQLAELSLKGFGSRKEIKERRSDGKSKDGPHLEAIIDILLKETGVDFSHYKLSTVRRRLNYRMLHCRAHSVAEYKKLLRSSSQEAQLLYKDLLIHVTRFFRDRPAFAYLKTTLLPKLLKKKTAGQSLRIWVPACSTGEEAYTIAMLVAELQEKNKTNIPVKIFASDLSQNSIRDARAGEYTEEDMKAVSAARQKKFFTRSGRNYRVVKSLREMCVFAPHNILQDPPFSRMDFVSCCNLLIYFDASAQEKTLNTLALALSDGGFLMLGKSESIGNTIPQFVAYSSKFKIYQRKKNSEIRLVASTVPRSPRATASRKSVKAPFVTRPVQKGDELEEAINAVLLSRYMPACAIINKELRILKFRGTAAHFLRHPAGDASLNILKMARPEFAFELSNTIREAQRSGREEKKTGIRFRAGKTPKNLTISASPIKAEGHDHLLMVVFTLTEQAENFPAGKKHLSAADEKGALIRRLQKELATTRKEMSAFIASQETVNSDLQNANEEIVSTNEEFQTLNEELETSKEEIEATNEELISTNQELQMRNDLLNESYSYSEAIIATIHEPMMIVDNKLCVKSANKAFYDVFGVTKEHTEGYSLYEMGNGQWNIPAVHKLLDNMLSRNAPMKNLEVRHSFPGIGEKILLLNASRIVQKIHREKLILLAIEDITERTMSHLREKEFLHKDITTHKADKANLEEAVKKRTRQLKLKNRELENANKDLTAFTYVSSHDLQEPLRKIKNFTTVLLEEEKGRLTPEGQMYLVRTYDTACRMQELIEDLLVYSRTKNAERIFEYVDLDAVVEALKLDLDDALEEKSGTITSSGDCSLRVMPFQFRQLLQNLISNSLKFADPERAPVITITAEKFKPGKEQPLQEMTGRMPDKNYCHLTYTDNGIGFDEQYSKLIFEVFQRLHSQEEYSGTGMGLAICKRIIENHSGYIFATGKPGEGARFDIFIPE